MIPEQDPSLKTLKQKDVVGFTGRRSGMMLRTALLTAWLGSALSFGAAAQTVTIGETAVLTLGDSGNGNLLVAQETSLSESATLQSLSFYVTEAAGELVLGVYTATGPNGRPGTLVAHTAAFKPSVGWNVASTTTTPTLAAGKYWLAYFPSSSNLSFVRENTTGSCEYYSLRFTSTLPRTFSRTPKSCTPSSWSFYATLATTTTPTLKLSDSPSTPSVPADAAVGTIVTALTASWSNGATFTGTLSFVSPYSSDGGLFALSANNVVVNGSLASLGATTQEITVQAQQSSSVSLNIPIAVTAVSSGGSGGSGGSPASILPPANDASANWKMAGMQSVGGIPNRTTVCATLTSNGGADNSTAINNAISACPPGEVVMLAAGTFNIAESSLIYVNNGVTLRGAGPGQTIINVPNGAVMNDYVCAIANCVYNPAILVGPQKYTTDWTPTTLTADAAQGATSVTVANTAGFAVGQWALIDEASGAAWQTDPMGYGQIWAAPDWLSSSNTPATGRVAWQKHNPSQSWDDFSSSTNPNTSGTSGCYYSFCDRPTSELHLITAISGNTITFDSPLTIAYRASGGHHAQLYYASNPFVTKAGVENLTIERSDQGGIVFQFCAYCWASNVETTLWLNGGFVTNYAARVELNTVYTHKCAWPVPGGGGYSIDIQQASTEIYVVNSISVLCDKVITTRSAGAGSVVAYNYMDDQFIGGNGSWQEIGINGSHAPGSHHVLFEGNYGSNIDSDDTHGNAIYHTFFRNYTRGLRAPFTDYTTGVGSTSGQAVNDQTQSSNGPLRAAGVMGYTYWMAFIGNVLGVSNVTTAANGWVDQSSFTGGPGIWLLGWNDQPPYQSDPNSTSWTYMDGNYDFLNKAITWNAQDTAHVLPNSLYLTSAPSFFGTNTWPWVNPLTGTVYTLPAQARYVAGTPF
jgi:hypothetical protein